jgi:hypothetical protein
MANEALPVSIAVGARWTVLYIHNYLFGVTWNWMPIYVDELGEQLFISYLRLKYKSIRKASYTRAKSAANEFAIFLWQWRRI